MQLKNFYFEIWNITFVYKTDFLIFLCPSQDQAMVGYEIIKTIGAATATYKFTPKYVLKAGQKVTVRVRLLLDVTHFLLNLLSLKFQHI